MAPAGATVKLVNQRGRFLKFINWFTVEDIEEPAQGWIPAIASAGYDGVQFLDPPPPDLIERAVQLGLRVCGSVSSQLCFVSHSRARAFFVARRCSASVVLTMFICG